MAVAVQATLGTWDPRPDPATLDGLIAVRVMMNDDLRSTSRGSGGRGPAGGEVFTVPSRRRVVFLESLHD